MSDCRYDIEGWCSYPGAVATWNLARGGLDENIPDKYIPVDNCVMCCAFHPAEPVSMFLTVEVDAN